MTGPYSRRSPIRFHPRGRLARISVNCKIRAEINNQIAPADSGVVSNELKSCRSVSSGLATKSRQSDSDSSSVTHPTDAPCARLVPLLRRLVRNWKRESARVTWSRTLLPDCGGSVNLCECVCVVFGLAEYCCPSALWLLDRRRRTRDAICPCLECGSCANRRRRSSTN